MQISLLSGGYESRSVIASAQRCVNLYPEVNQRETYMMMPQLAGAPTIITHYPTPGLTKIAQGEALPVRGVYRASNDQVYVVIGPSVYSLNRSYQLTALGTIANNTNRVSMADNGVYLVLVDGSPAGYTIDLSTNTFADLVDPTGLFTGADSVQYVDTFFVFNKRDSQAFYSSLSNSITFDPLYIANKTAYADKLVNLVVAHREIWLLGERTTEVWYDAGAADFPFAAVPGAFIQHGCAAKDSVCVAENTVFWLAKDQQGNAIALQGANYNAQRISTHSIENEFQSYSRIDDAVGHVHQVQGHTFWVLSFPTADRTWVYDLASNLWHERVYIDSSGVEHRARTNVGTAAYGVYIVGDYENGNLYTYDINNYTDDGNPIKRLRSFPHVENELKRVVYSKFIADMQAGGTLDPTVTDLDVSLRWSDDRGVSFGNPVTQSLGGVGEGIKNIQWRRLGMARDRVFELSWSSPVLTALNGAYADIVPSAS